MCLFRDRKWILQRSHLLSKCQIISRNINKYKFRYPVRKERPSLGKFSKNPHVFLTGFYVDFLNKFSLIFKINVTFGIQICLRPELKCGCQKFCTKFHRILIISLKLYATCIILQYVYKPRRCTNF